MGKRILFISRTALKSNTSAGNTTQNLFSFCNKEECANIYCREEIPNIDMCQKYYCISENQLIKGVFNNSHVGKEFSFQQIDSLGISEDEEKKRYDAMKKHRLIIFLWIRELIWCITKKKWNNKELRKFVKEFSPEIIYMPVYDCFYMHKLLYEIKRYSPNAKILLYSGDDMYSYNRYRISPFYYVNQYILRRYIKKSMDKASAIICFSKLETEMFRSMYQDKVHQIYKSYNVPGSITFESQKNDKLRLLYAGNLAYGRWKTLAMIGRAIDRINTKNRKIVLDVYTATDLSKSQLDRIKRFKSIKLHKEVPYEELKTIQSKSDILLNIESFDKKDMETVKMSFSTKIVDYLFAGKCILSIGPIKVNSINYLVNAGVSLYAKNMDKLMDVLNSIVDNKETIEIYAKKAYEFGSLNHDSSVVNEKMKYLLDNI